MHFISHSGLWWPSLAHEKLDIHLPAPCVHPSLLQYHLYSSPSLSVISSIPTTSEIIYITGQVQRTWQATTSSVSVLRVLFAFKKLKEMSCQWTVHSTHCVSDADIKGSAKCFVCTYTPPKTFFFLKITLKGFLPCFYDRVHPKMIFPAARRRWSP